jgi:hypothetical protein
LVGCLGLRLAIDVLIIVRVVGSFE